MELYAVGSLYTTKNWTRDAEGTQAYSNRVCETDSNNISFNCEYPKEWTPSKDYYNSDMKVTGIAQKPSKIWSK